MKKVLVIVSVLAMLFCGGTAKAQVSESAEWASKIKAEGLGNSKVEEISQYMTDFMGSRLTASRQKRRADSLVIVKLKELGFSNPRSAFAMEFTRGGWDVVKTYAAMTNPYYCAFSVNPRAWSGSTKGLVKGECIVFDVKSKEDLEKYRGKVAGKILLMPSTQSYDINFEPLASRYTDEELAALTNDNRANPRGGRYGRMNVDYRALMDTWHLTIDTVKTFSAQDYLHPIPSFYNPSPVRGRSRMLASNLCAFLAIAALADDCTVLYRCLAALAVRIDMVDLEVRPFQLAPAFVTLLALRVRPDDSPLDFRERTVAIFLVKDILQDVFHNPFALATVCRSVAALANCLDIRQRIWINLRLSVEFAYRLVRLVRQNAEPLKQISRLAFRLSILQRLPLSQVTREQDHKRVEVSKFLEPCCANVGQQLGQIPDRRLHVPYRLWKSPHVNEPIRH